ncbi:MAG: PIN domain-containing protein [Kiritimatiellae bacterium]|nr:PIN domain-containing protein [Kiritimatiellia bacterium]
MKRVFLDTAPLIYLLEGGGNRQQAVVAQLRYWAAHGVWLETTVLTLTELLTGPRQAGNESLARQYRAGLADLLGRPLLVIDERTADYAASLRAKFKFRTPDALQLSAAIQAGCEAFYTNDTRLRACAEIEVVLVDAKATPA